MKRQLLDSLLLTLLLIFVISFPVNYFITDTLSYYLVEIGLRLLLLTYYYFSLRKSGRSIVGQENWKEIAVLSPIFLVSVSNLILCAVYPKSVTFSYIDRYFALQIVLDLLTACVEEIVFRFYIHNMLRISNRLVRIIASSGIFAAFHLLNLINGYSVGVLIQAAYAFGLGILLGFLYEYGHSLLMCIGLHFMFNALNGTLFEYIFQGLTESQSIVYYCVNGGIAAAAAVYLLIIFFVRYRKVNRLYFY